MENYKLYALHSDILNVIGQYNITPAMAYFVINDIVNDLKKIYLEQVSKEIETEKNKRGNKEDADTQIIEIGADTIKDNKTIEVPLTKEAKANE